jgi:hypothetical protein
MDMEIQDDADKERDRFLRLRFALFIYLFIVPKALRDSPYFSLRQ